LKEARDNKYFIDGFMIKHFGVFPIGIDKNNFFEEQKMFLICLMGFIPNIDDWAIQMDYKSQEMEIEEMTIENVKLSNTDKDVAKLQKLNIEDIKKDRLKTLKKQKKYALNKKFGIEEEDNNENINIDGKVDITELIPNENENIREDLRKKKLWDLLQGNQLDKAEE
jgi:hypothetical protein